MALNRKDVYTLGSDPELFLQRDSAPLPVCGLIGGTKEKPIPMEGMPKGYFIQEDNVMLEFNIPPAMNSRQFASNIQQALLHIFTRVKETLNADIIPSCRVLFPAAVLNRQGAHMFGCSKDFDAYANGQAHAPLEPTNLRGPGGEWRFAGGHIHVGYAPRGIPEFVAAQFADVFLGLRSVPYDKQEKRRQLYGKAGRFRPTPYGIEYRTLSNFWLFDEGLTRGIAQDAEAFASFMHIHPLDHISKMHSQMPWTDVQSAINREDVKLAGDLLAYARNSLHIGEPLNG
jgi:hypothetical protein